MSVPALVWVFKKQSDEQRQAGEARLCKAKRSCSLYSKAHTTMECPVCFEEYVCIKLICGHGVCPTCVKKWSLKGCNDGCPMCRKPMYYRGCREQRQKWAEEKQEAEYVEFFGKIIQEVSESLIEDNEERYFLGDMRDIESTFNALKEDGMSPDQIEYLIFEEGWYISGRLKFEYDDEPQKESIMVWRPAHNIVV